MATIRKPRKGPKRQRKWVDPVIEHMKKDVDLELIGRNLKLTHEQRLQNLCKAMKFLATSEPIVLKRTKYFIYLQCDDVVVWTSKWPVPELKARLNR